MEDIYHIEEKTSIKFTILWIVLIVAFIAIADRLASGYWILEYKFHPVISVQKVDDIDCRLYNLDNEPTPIEKLVTIEIQYKDLVGTEVVNISNIVSVKCRLEKDIINKYQKNIQEENESRILLNKAKELTKQNCNN